MAEKKTANGYIEYTNKPLCLYKNQNDELFPMQNANVVEYNSNNLYVKNTANISNKYIHNSPHIELSATNLKNAVDEINERVVKGGRYFNQINLTNLADSDNRLLSTYIPVKIDFFPSAQKYIMLLYNTTSNKSVLCTSDNGILFDTIVGEILGTLDSMCVIGGKAYFAGCATNYIEEGGTITTQVTSGIYSISDLAQFTSEGNNQFTIEHLIYTYMSQEGRVTPDSSYLVSCNTSMSCDEDSICVTIYNKRYLLWSCVTIKLQYGQTINYIINQHNLNSRFEYPQVTSINGGTFIIFSYRATTAWHYMVYCPYNVNSILNTIYMDSDNVLRSCYGEGESIYGVQQSFSNIGSWFGDEGLYYKDFSNIFNGIEMPSADVWYIGNMNQQLIMRIGNIYIYKYCYNDYLYYSTQPLDSEDLTNGKKVFKQVVFYSLDNTKSTTNTMKKGFVINKMAYVIDLQNRLYYSQIDI